MLNALQPELMLELTLRLACNEAKRGGDIDPAVAEQKWLAHRHSLLDALNEQGVPKYNVYQLDGYFDV